MINPILQNFEIQFSEDFFPELITEKYDNFLFHKNYPFKTLKSYLLETIQNLDIPGINLQTILVAGLNNTGLNNNDFSGLNHQTVNRSYPGTSPVNEVVEGVSVVITFRNTLLNWMYCYEVLYRYYARKRSMKDFYINLTMSDSAEIPMIRFSLYDCFISAMPGLSFNFVNAFNETNSFNVTFTFNKFDVSFIVPEFDLKKVILKK